MGKDDTTILIVGGIALVGVAFLFKDDIMAMLNMGDASAEELLPEEEAGALPSDEGEAVACDTPKEHYYEYYAQRVAEELNKYRLSADRDPLKRNAMLEIKGRALLSYKNDFKRMYQINQGCIVALEGEAQAIFVDVILRLADRMHIKIPNERKRVLHRLREQGYSQRSFKARYQPTSTFEVTNIIVG